MRVREGQSGESVVCVYVPRKRKRPWSRRRQRCRVVGSGKEGLGVIVKYVENE